jgi:DNA anti-recombination protein RmuC
MRNLVIVTITLLSMFLFFVPECVRAYESAGPLTDREIIERLARLEEGQKAIREEIRAGFQAIDQRFQAIDQRFQSIDLRFQSIDQRFEQITNLITGIVASFSGLVAVMIGFAVWDRRTMIRPFESKVREIEKNIGSNQRQMHNLLEALRQLAQQDSKLAEVLKSFALL